MSPPDVASPVPMQAIVDLLERKAPEQLARLREAYPLAAAQLAGGKRLGDAQAPAAPLLSALADAVASLKSAMVATEAEGELRLMQVRNDFADLDALIRKLNAAVATTRQIELALG